jgi:prophage regulatory protein
MNHREQVLRWVELKEKIRLSRSTVWRMEKAGKFPKRRQISPNSVGWLSSEVDQWLTERDAPQLGGAA